MKKLTAVEWLWEQLLNLDIEFDSVLIGRTSYLVKRNYILIQANKLFEEQIVDGWHNGYNNQSPMIDEENCGEQYYNETFNQSQS